MVDEGTNMVIKFNPPGKVMMVLGHRPPAVAGAVATTNGPPPPASIYLFGRPTDMGSDPQGNIFVSNGYVNNRAVKHDIGALAALCITPGSHQYLYSSKLPKEFGTVNALNCRGENDLLVGELGNWRVQRLTLYP